RPRGTVLPSRALTGHRVPAAAASWRICSTAFQAWILRMEKKTWTLQQVLQHLQGWHMVHLQRCLPPNLCGATLQIPLVGGENQNLEAILTAPRATRQPCRKYSALL
ncbi:mCG145892, partial [Mus musculus]